VTKTSQKLGALLPDVISMLHARVAGDTLAVMHDSGLTLPQIVVLHILRHEGSQSVGFLGTALRLSPSATSHLVDRLYEQKLVQRTEDPVDRRQKVVAITPKGQKLTDRLADMRAAELATAIGDHLDPELQTELLRILETVMNALRRSPRC
jgi:DNA-binding MarR family transcriptional regulator